jgi:uncharacterized protein YkwD
MSDQFSRRRFLRSSACLAFGPYARNLPETLSLSSNDDKLFDEIRNQLLQQVNEEREVAKVKPVQIDQLATEVATRHAREMAKHGYASHWNREGLKPYHRYSFAGGYHSTQENISAADKTWSSKPRDLIQDTSYLHVRLYNETPPNDGHRQAILAPQQTHVGFGIALEELRLRVVELYVAKHVQLNVPETRKAKPGDTFLVSGKLLGSNHSLRLIEVFYEPLPKELGLDQLRVSGSYSLPNDAVELRPKLPPPFLYADRKIGVIDVVDDRFSVPITLYKPEPGIYTIVCWIKLTPTGKAFPATELCIRAD